MRRRERDGDTLGLSWRFVGVGKRETRWWTASGRGGDSVSHDSPATNERKKEAKKQRSKERKKEADVKLIVDATERKNVVDVTGKPRHHGDGCNGADFEGMRFRGTCFSASANKRHPRQTRWPQTQTMGVTGFVCV